ncbi:MAG: uridine kinase [Candidatus Marinimicrobia bacterium]|nr:uridine kinase [Candidatus Neomarinimicrobiota bacterium]
MNYSSKVHLIGIGGGTGSGKTLLARRLTERFSTDSVGLIELDSYYKDLTDLPMTEREQRNYDHPDAFDWNLLRENIAEIHAGNNVQIPVYDYTTHTRSSEVRTLSNLQVVFVEGILVLHNREIRDHFSIKIYVDTDADIRVLRRLKRDIRKRGRTIESVMEQYQQTVKPMHEQYVEPTRKHADIIVPHGGKNHIALDLLSMKIQSLINQ